MGMSQRIDKGALLRMSPAQLIAFVARTTLAEISSWSTQDLIDIGWLNNPTVDRLYDLGNTGVYAARQGSTTPIERYQQAYLDSIAARLDITTAGGIGKTMADRVTEARMLNASAYALQAMPDTVNVVSTEAAALLAQRRLGITLLTSDGAGAVAATELVPALAGMKGHLEILGIIGTDTDAASTWSFTTTTGPTRMTGCLSTDFALNITASVVNTQLAQVRLRATVANEACRVAVTGYAASKTLYIYYRYWHEA